jgi:hypothetical protein
VSFVYDVNENDRFRFWVWLKCVLFHNSFKVIEFYSNRTHRVKCSTCHREWDTSVFF